MELLSMICDFLWEMQHRIGRLFIATFIILTAFLSFFIIFPLSVISGIVGATLSEFCGNKATVHIRQSLRNGEEANGEQDLEKPLTAAEICQFFANFPIWEHLFGRRGDLANEVEEIGQEVLESDENDGIQESQEQREIQEDQGVQETPEVPEDQGVQETPLIQESQQAQESQEHQDIQEHQEIPEMQENQVIQESSEPQQVPENHENQGIQEDQPIQNIHEAPEVPEVQENQELPKEQEVQEQQEIQESQVIQKSPEIQQVQQSSELPKEQEVPESQVIQKSQETPEHQEIPEIQESQVIQESSEHQETQKSPEIQQIQQSSELPKEQEVPEVKEAQVVQEHQEIQNSPEVSELQENPVIQESREDQEASEVPVLQEQQVIEKSPEIQQIQQSSESPETPKIQKNQELPKEQEVLQTQQSQQIPAILEQSIQKSQETQEPATLQPEKTVAENPIPAPKNHQNLTDSDINEESNESEKPKISGEQPLNIIPNFFERIDKDEPIIERSKTPQNQEYIVASPSDCSSEGKEIEEKLETSPEKLENSPEKLENSPEKLETSPEKLENSPEKLENSPEKLENSPEKLENSPEKLENSPEKLENSPEKLAEKSAENSKIFDTSVYVVNFNEHDESLSKISEISQKPEENVDETPSNLSEKLKTSPDMLQFAYVSTENLGQLVNAQEPEKKSNFIGVEQNLTDVFGTELEIAQKPNLHENSKLAQKIQGNTEIFEQHVEIPTENEHFVDYPKIVLDLLGNLQKQLATENPKPVPNPAENVDISTPKFEISGENKKIVENFLKNGHSPSKDTEIPSDNEENDEKTQEKPLIVEIEEAKKQLDEVIAKVAGIPDKIDEFIVGIQNPASSVETSHSPTGEIRVPQEIKDLMELVKTLVEQQKNEHKLVELSPELRKRDKLMKELHDLLEKQVKRMEAELEKRNLEKLAGNAENQGEIVEIPSENSENSEDLENIQKIPENSEVVQIPSENSEDQENIQNPTEKPPKPSGKLSILSPTKKIFEKSQIPVQTPPGTPTLKASRFDEIVEKSSRSSTPRKMESNGASARIAQRHFQTLQIPTEILTTNANLLKTPDNLENFAEKLVDYSKKTSKSLCLVTIRDLATLTDLPITAENVSRITLKKKKVKVMTLEENEELKGNLTGILEKVLENPSGAATWIHFLKDDGSSAEKIVELHHSELKKIAREFYGESSKFAGNLSGINSELLALSKDGYIWFNAGKIIDF